VKIDWHAIRNLSVELDRPIGTLIVLSGDNDPFYVREARMRAAEWFAALYREYGFGRGIHIRRIHYRIVSQREPVKLPDGSDYENTTECSKALGAAASSARYAGLVDAKDFDDRRNPEPTLLLPEQVAEPLIEVVGGGLTDFDIDPNLRVEIPRFVVPDSFEMPSIDISAPFQWPFHIEIWCEKSTVNDVLEPLAHQYGLNLQTALGEISITRCEELVARSGGRPVRIIYISDFDPGGESMPVAAARKIEWFTRGHEDKTGEKLDIQLHPIVLTKAQCEEYGLPRTPIKETERRAARFEDRHGEGATELDALEALHPGELSRILIAEIEKFRDPSFAEEWRQVRHDAAGEIDELASEILDRHVEAIDTLEQRRADLKALADERLANIQRQVDERLADLRALAEEQMADLQRQADELMADAAEVNAEIEQDLEDAKPDADEFNWPEPTDGWDDPLLDSTRDYIEQVDRYKAHQGKPTSRKVNTFETRQSLVCTVCGTAFNAYRGDAKFCSPSCRSRARQSRRRSASA
jgi:rubrerythrin